MKTKRTPVLRLLNASASLLLAPAVLAQQEPPIPFPPLPPLPPISGAPATAPFFAQSGPNDVAPEFPPSEVRRRMQGGGSSFFGGGAETRRPLPMIGVVTRPVLPETAEQLGLSPGFGLVVDKVLPNTPAAEAGLKENDILKLADDQRLVSPDQLGALIRSKGKDSTVNLTLLRRGEEKVLKVKVVEQEIGRLAEGAFPPAPKRPDGEGFGFGTRRDGEATGNPFEQQQRRVREMQERVRQFEREMREWGENGGKGEMPTLKIEGMPGTPEGPRSGRGERPDGGVRRDGGDRPGADVRPEGGDRPRRKEPSEGHSDVRVQVQGTDVDVRTSGSGTAFAFSQSDVNGHQTAKVKRADESGEYELEVNGDDTRFTARDKKGRTQFDGPIRDEKDREKLPEELREKYDALRKGLPRKPERTNKDRRDAPVIPQ